MNTIDTVPAQENAMPAQGLAERMVIKLLDKMPRGGLRVEHADGRVRHFGARGSHVTGRVKIKDDAEFFKGCAF